MSNKIGIVIPTYNERKNISILIPKIFKICYRNKINASVLVVDDNSSDGTIDTVRNLKRKFSIDILVRKKKLGLGSAYKAGFKKFLKKDFYAIVEMDADLSHDPKYIPKMLKKIQNSCDVVIGSRRVAGGKTKDWSNFRKLISYVDYILTKFFVNISIKDVTSGYRIYKTGVIRSIDIKKIKSNGFAFQVEILYRIILKKFRICEVPIEFVDRKFGKSKLSISDILETLKTLVRLKIEGKN